MSITAIKPGTRLAPRSNNETRPCMRCGIEVTNKPRSLGVCRDCLHPARADGWINFKPGSGKAA